MPTNVLIYLLVSNAKAKTYPSASTTLLIK